MTGRRPVSGNVVVEEGDWLSIDGAAGTIHLGRGKVVADRPEAELAQVARWRQRSRANTADESSGPR
jgi:pyruvate,orthophosphate dikinase